MGVEVEMAVYCAIPLPIHFVIDCAIRCAMRNYDCVGLIMKKEKKEKEKKRKKIKMCFKTSRATRKNEE